MCGPACGSGAVPSCVPRVDQGRDRRSRMAADPGAILGSTFPIGWRAADLARKSSSDHGERELASNASGLGGGHLRDAGLATCVGPVGVVRRRRCGRRIGLALAGLLNERSDLLELAEQVVGVGRVTGRRMATRWLAVVASAGGIDDAANGAAWVAEAHYRGYRLVVGPTRIAGAQPALVSAIGSYAVVTNRGGTGLRGRRSPPLGRRAREPRSQGECRAVALPTGRFGANSAWAVPSSIAQRHRAMALSVRDEDRPAASARRSWAARPLGGGAGRSATNRPSVGVRRWIEAQSEGGCGPGRTLRIARVAVRAWVSRCCWRRLRLCRVSVHSPSPSTAGRSPPRAAPTAPVAVGRVLAAAVAVAAAPILAGPAVLVGRWGLGFRGRRCR